MCPMHFGGYNRCAQCIKDGSPTPARLRQHRPRGLAAPSRTLGRDPLQGRRRRPPPLERAQDEGLGAPVSLSALAADREIPVEAVGDLQLTADREAPGALLPAFEVARTNAPSRFKATNREEPNKLVDPSRRRPPAAKLSWVRNAPLRLTSGTCSWSRYRMCRMNWVVFLSRLNSSKPCASEARIRGERAVDESRYAWRGGN